MDDLVKAILISFDQFGNIDSSLKSQAIAFCDQIKQTPSICSICIEGLRCSKLVHVQFWCLQCLHEVLQVRYSTMSLEEKGFIRNSVFSMARFEDIKGENSVRVLETPVKNKLAQVLVTLIYFEYPLVWPSVFVDYLPHLSKGGVVIDMFCRVLNSLDDELISQDYPKSAEEMAVATQVKDNMREQCISQIVKAWYDIICTYRKTDQELCTSVLDTMNRYVTWIDINLVANEAFIPLLFELILVDESSDNLRGAAIYCLLAIVSKRMDQKAKLRLLQSLQISRLIGLVGRTSDNDYVPKLADLFTGYASEALDCYKILKSDNTVGIIPMELLDEVLPSVFYFMQNSEFEPSLDMVQFLSNYVATMKSISLLTEKQKIHVGQILEVIRILIRYDSCYRDNLDCLDKIGKEEEDRMADFRKDYYVLLRGVGRVAPDICQIFIRDSLINAANSSVDRNVEEVEAALSLFYAYGESLTDEAMRNSRSTLRDLVPTLLSTRFSCHNSRLVALVYLETVTRYMKFIQENMEHIPAVLTAFLDERGIHHPNINVSRRASYLFMKVVKLLKAKLVPFIEKILQSLQDKVANFTHMSFSSKELSGSEDGSHIFEAIGLLIGLEDVPIDKQTEFLSALLTPLLHQVEALLSRANVHNHEDSPSKISNIQQIIMAINALSKGFSERLATASRPGIGLMFKQTLDVLLQVLVVYPKIDPLRSKVTSFIHRMVETLGTNVLPYLPTALEQLLAETEQPKQMMEFLVLLNQLINKFTTSIHDILNDAYPAVSTRIFNILPRDGFPTGPGSNTEEIRELQELQRTFYTFLHVIAMHDLSSIFLSSKSRTFLDPMMQLLLHTCCNHKEISVRKVCVQIFIRLIKDWSSRSNGEEKVPGFQSFVVETFATSCCLYSVLDKSFELHDANSLILFGEIVVAQKVMYEKFGNDFLIHFASKVLPTAHCARDLAEQYCQRLQGNDMKALKSFYQSLIEKLRLQQNGSLVFR